MCLQVTEAQSDEFILLQQKVVETLVKTMLVTQEFKKDLERKENGSKSSGSGIY